MGQDFIDAERWLRGETVGRKKHTKMIIKDVKVQDGKCIISLEIRRGANTWIKAYGFTANYLKEGEFEEFKANLYERVLKDAYRLEEDKNFQDRVIMRIEDMINKTVTLD